MIVGTGVGPRAVQRYLGGRTVCSRIRKSRLFKDPELTAKLRDIAGLYFDPPGHSVEENRGIYYHPHGRVEEAHH